MKTPFAAALLVLVTARGSQPPVAPVPVLVELFTSEGCSSCPTADALLASLQREQPVPGAFVIPIGLHVDYFDHAGWKDTFSSPAFTERQRHYSERFGPDSVYTPQMVIDGREAVEGNDAGLVRRTIAGAAARAHWPLGVTVRATDGGVLLRIDAPAAPAGAERIQLLAAITQDGLTTAVKRGENGGRTLHHAAVTRRLQAIGLLARQPGVVERELKIDRKWGPGPLTAIAWLQGVTSRQVYGAAIIPIGVDSRRLQPAPPR
jgi:hypothetical protein